MVLSEGHIIYHGPKEQIEPFFGSLGFYIPERKEVADFLQVRLLRYIQNGMG